MKKCLKISLLCCVLVVSTISYAKVEIIDRVVALVDGDVILASELVRRTNEIVNKLKSRNQKSPPIEVLKKQVLERLVIESLQLQMAKRVGVRVNDTELDAMLEKIAQDNQVSLQEFKRNIQAEGKNWALFREDLRTEIMIGRVRNGVVSRRIKISEKEVENLLQQINQEGESKVQYSLGHIFLPLAEGADPEDVAKIRTQAEKIISELRQGANFEEYAVTYSAGENALNGGNLGWRSLSQLPTLFADSVKNMKALQISEPLRSGGGLHILKLKEVKGDFEKHSVIQTNVRHILISPNAILDNKAALDKIKLIRQRIIKGENFEDLAIEFSDDKGSGSLGGSLDWSESDKFVPEFSAAMDALAIGELSQPIKSEFGFHLIEVLGRRDQDQTEEKKKERAYRILHGRKFEEEAQNWLRELKGQAYIKLIDEK